MKIKVEKFSEMKYYAKCKDCTWNAEIFMPTTYSKQDVRNAIRRHMKQTRHNIDLETEFLTQYRISY